MSKVFTFAVAVVLATAILFAQGARATFADERDFTVYNQSNVSITGLYVAAASASDWGFNQLSGPILAGSSFLLHFQPGDAGNECVFDIRFIGSDGTVTFDYGVDLCTTDYVTFS